MFLRERLDQIELNDDTVDTLRKRHARIVLPWLDTGGNPDHFGRNDAMNDLLEYYLDLCEHIDFLRTRAFNRIQDGIRAERLQGKIAGKKETELPKLLNPEKDIELIPYDQELLHHKMRIERFLGWGGDTLLGISLDNPDDNKNIVLRTPVIMDQTKTRKVYTGGGSGEGDVHKIPE